MAEGKNLHDQTFKDLAREKIVAQALLKAHLPTAILKQIELEKIELWNASYVRKRQERHSDVVYRARVEDGGDAYIVLAFEHQSKPEALLPLRSLEYTTALMPQHIKQGHTKLPLVIPLIFYHGTVSPYPYTLDLFECFESPALARTHFLKPLMLIDVTVMPDEQLKQNIITAPMQLMMKHIRDENLMPPLLDLFCSGILSKNMKVSDGRLTEIILSYAVDCGKIPNYEAFDELLQQVHDDDEMREVAMTMREHFEQRGLERGLERGHHRATQAMGLLLKGVPPDSIVAETGLPLSAVQSLQQVLASSEMAIV